MACLPTTTPHTHTAGQRFFCTRSCRPPLSLPSPRVALTVELHEVDGGPAQPRPRLIHSLMNGGGREGGGTVMCRGPAQSAGPRLIHSLMGGS